MKTSSKNNNQSLKNILFTDIKKNSNNINPLYILLQKIIHITKNNTIQILNKNSEETNITEINHIITSILDHPNEKIKKSTIEYQGTNLSFLFSKQNFIKKPINLNRINTKYVNYMKNTFEDAFFSKDTCIKYWIIKNVKYFTSMFQNSHNIYFNLSLWEWHNAQILNYMFENTKNNNVIMNNVNFKQNVLLLYSFKNSDCNINFNTWKFIKTPKSKPNNYEINKTRITGLCYNCKKQTNTFSTWDFNNTELNNETFHNCEKITPITSNFYKARNCSLLRPFLYTKNIIPYFYKYNTLINYYSLHDTLKRYIRSITYWQIKQNKYLKNYKKYVEYVKTKL